MIWFWKWPEIAVSMVTTLWTGRWRNFGFIFGRGNTFLCFLRSPILAPHSAPCSVGTGDSARVWCWPLTFIWCESSEWVELIPQPPAYTFVVCMGTSPLSPWNSMFTKSSYTISVKKGASTLLLDRVVVHYCCPVIVEVHKGSLEGGGGLKTALDCCSILTMHYGIIKVCYMPQTKTPSASTKCGPLSQSLCSVIK
jgi:hypothetical protein